MDLPQKYQCRVVESRSDLLQAKIEELRGSGLEVIKIDLLRWNSTQRLGTYNLIAFKTSPR